MKPVLMALVIATCPLIDGAAATADGTGNVQVNHLVSRPALIIEELEGLNIERAAVILLATLSEIEQAQKLTPEDRAERIAEAVGCAVAALTEASPDVMRTISPDLRPERLSLITASAVVASQAHSQDIVGSLLEGRADPGERQAIEAAAAEPDKHLTRQELRVALRCMPAVRPMPIRPQPIRPLEERSPRSAPAAPAPAPVYDGQ